MKKLIPSNLEIGTYTTDTVKIVGCCLFYLVHPGTKMLQEVTFYVAKNNGSVLLSCTTTLALGLIQPFTITDYLPSQASLKTSSFDHPRKTKRVSVHRSKKELSTQSRNQAHAQQLLSQVSHKQRADVAKLPWCFWGYQVLSRSPMSYPDRSKCYPQADTLQTSPSTFERTFQTRDWQDAQSRSSESSA